MLSAAEILEAADLQTEALDVPEWGGQVYIRTMTAGERDRFEMSLRGENLEGSRAKFAALVIGTESGARLFDDADAEALAGKSSKALERVLEAGLRLNGISEADLEDATKN